MGRKSVSGMILVALAAAACLMLFACNTMEGVGKDIERAGEGVQKAAD